MCTVRKSVLIWSLYFSPSSKTRKKSDLVPLVVHICMDLQGGKTFGASFCASLIAGSRRAFQLPNTASLCLTICLFITERLNEMHKVWTSASRKAFILLCVFCFSSLENYFGLRTTNVKGNTDHPVSLMSGIKSFEQFQRGEYFDCAFDLFVSCFAVFRRAELKPACILLLVNTFSHAQIYSLCRTSFIHLFSQRTICAP